MNIALLGTRGIPANYGGFETFAEQIALQLVQRGHKVTVYAEADTDNKPDDWYQNIRIRYIRRPNWGSISVIAYDYRCLKDASKREFDFLYMLGYGAAWACWWALKIWNQNVWINIDGLEWARSKWKWYAKLYLRVMEWVASKASTRVIADSQAIADRYNKLYPRGSECSFIAYGAYIKKSDEFLFRYSQDFDRSKYFLIVARPEPENHVLEIINSHRQLGGNWPLVVVGDVRSISRYQKKILGSAWEKVIFLGGVYDAEELTALRVHSGCYVHGHSVGGTNPSLLEAMACENVVIAHDNVFNKEVIGDAAFYFKNEDDLIVAMRHVENQSVGERGEIKCRVKKIIEKKYTWGLIGDKYERLMLQRKPS